MYEAFGYVLNDNAPELEVLLRFIATSEKFSVGQAPRLCNLLSKYLWCGGPQGEVATRRHKTSGRSVENP